MRVALFAWETLHSVPVGGVAVHVTELAAALQRRGHEVHVFARTGEWQPRDESIDGVWYHRCTFRLDSSFVDEVQDMCRSFVARFEEVQRFSGRFDIAHAHDWLTSNAMVWVKEGSGVSGVLTIHSTEYGRCGNAFYGGPSGRIRDHERNGTYCADRVIAVSNALKREICWMYEVPDWKVATIYNAVNAHHYSGFIDPAPVRKHFQVGPVDPMVLFVGRMCVQKGADILVRAAPMVLAHHPQTKFVFVGDGAERSGYEALSHHLRVDHAVRFLGYRNGGLLKDLFRACDVVAVPSRNEPFGIVVLEAWAAGKPVVATHNGGPGEFVSHEVNGLKVYDRPESVAWGIGTLFQDFERARWMGHNGRLAAESAFTWDRIAEQTAALYQSI